MKLFKKVAVIGVGLIGGSVALAIKRKGLAEIVVGVSRHSKTLNLAKKIKAIDAGSLSLEIVSGADLVIFATPVKTILELAPRVAVLVKKDCLVTDVGSTKKEIVSKLDKLFKNYLGSHPLAGSEKRGIFHAKNDIFQKSLCIVTPTGKTTPIARREISALWQRLGAQVAVLSADRHDQVIAFVSHLPHLAAFTLIQSVPPGDLKFSASGLKDTTRIAASDTALWADILLSNKKIFGAIKAFEANFKKIRSTLLRRDKRALVKILAAAKAKRETLG